MNRQSIPELHWVPVIYTKNVLPESTLVRMMGPELTQHVYAPSAP